MNADPTSLDRLHDIIVPPPTPWWPPAPAWYFVITALALTAILLLIWGLRHWLRNRYRHEALAELKRYEAALAEPAHRAESMAGLAELLKRTALSAWPREEVASLTGPDWLAFLDRSAQTTAFANGSGQDLERVTYDPRIATTLTEPQLREIATLVRHWLKHHQVSTKSP